MTEHAAVIFVFFFLAEYASIVLMCVLTSILFIGGYLLFDYLYVLILINDISNYIFFIDSTVYIEYIKDIVNNPILEGLLYGLSLGFKSSIMIFIFI
jgi:NADH-ubiquinone oxidoreductase chain 1